MCSGICCFFLFVELQALFIGETCSLNIDFGPLTVGYVAEVTCGQVVGILTCYGAPEPAPAGPIPAAAAGSRGHTVQRGTSSECECDADARLAPPESSSRPSSGRGSTRQTSSYQMYMMAEVKQGGDQQKVMLNITGCLSVCVCVRL